jgi:CHC2 zinc finger
VYVGVAARRTSAGGKDAIARVWTLWADLDQPDAHARLDALPVTPAILITSGTAGHRHAYWPLARPVSIQAAEAANRRLAAQLGADTGAVTNAATILRPPGTYSFKTDPPTPVVLERLDDELTTLYAATAGIADDPTPAAAAGLATSTPRPGEDPLRALDPAYYVSALTGQAVGRSRKISCPFHEDRTPSFHVYEHPEDGFYCFGCRRHGHTAYDLASALWGLQTRGEQFLQLRARLYDLLLPGHTPPVMPRARAR